MTNKKRIFAVLSYSGLLLSAVSLCAESPRPLLALGFEDVDNAKSVFGNWVYTVPEGRHGHGGMGGQERFTPNPLNAYSGTLMMWAKLEKRAPQSAFHHRLFNLGNTSLGISGAYSTIAPYGGWKATYAKHTVIETGDWHHWALTWRGTERRFYIDGELVLTAEGSDLAGDAPPYFLLRFHDYETAWVVDDLKLFGESLSPEHIITERDTPVIHDVIGRDGSPSRPQELQDGGLGDTALPIPFTPHPVTYGPEQLVANPTMTLA